MTREEIHTDDAPAAQGPYSQAIATDSLLFCAGQGGLDPATAKTVEGGVEAQTEQTIANLKAVLEAGGSSLADVLKTTCFLADMDDFAAFNAVYTKYFPAPQPARTTIAAKQLPLGLLVEIEAIAQRR